MINQLNNYFSAEKQESVIFITVGLMAMGVSAWLWMNGHRLKSMAYPLVVIALMQMVVGVSIYLHRDRLGLTGRFDADSGYLCRNPRIHLFVCSARHARLKNWAWRSVLHLTFCSEAHVYFVASRIALPKPSAPLASRVSAAFRRSRASRFWLSLALPSMRWIST
jgi:hypothetical protein